MLLPKIRSRVKENSKKYAERSITEIGTLPDPQPGKQTEFLNSTADIVLYGGSAGGGKSLGLLLKAASKEYLANPDYNATIFRRTYPELKNPGGLLDESLKLYRAIGGNLVLNMLEWKFKNGAKIVFRQIQHEKTVYEYQGSQLNFCGFDELTHFSSKQFFYMLSRNRSTSGIKPIVRATCNPDADSWVFELVEWYIDEFGYPIEDRSGIVRWFVRINEELIWAESEKELSDRYPELIPKSFCFIAANIYDNQILLQKDPGYLANLMALHPVEKQRLLEGNWKIRYEAGTIFDRTWFEIVDRAPDSGTKVRFWDLAATAKEVAKASSFYTAGILLKKVGDTYYIEDAIAEQRKAGDIELLIKQTALMDGRSVKVRWELEGGSAGIILANIIVEQFNKLSSNFDAKATKPLGDKVTRAIAPATAANRGKIKIVKGTWNTTLLNALSKFDGTPQPLINDLTDALSGAYAELEKTVDRDYSGRFSRKTGFRH